MNRLYETAFRRLLYPAYESGLRRRGTLRYLAQYERDQWLSTDEIMALQWRKLERLLDYCWTRIPYYRDRWTGRRYFTSLARTATATLPTIVVRT